ncbi:MAG: phosphoribosylformylglycinamidine cyclo-ligase [Ignavibacteria bacterium]
MSSTYAASGVNIPEGEKFVEKIKPLVKSTFSRHVLSGVGNFGAFFRIPDGYKEPVFVSSTDGVGTKLKITVALNKHDTIGEDIVNHSVNDIAVCGATPLFFLDYLAFGKLNYKTATKIVKGLIRGCKRNNCSLIGGETAEMPDIYKKKDYDVAGTVVGIVDKKKIIDKKNVKAGNMLIGLKSNGLHTNGYTLARKVLLNKLKLTGYLDELGCTLGEELLKVHRTYLKIIQSLVNKFKISSISHITGGGIVGNTKRVVPDNLKIKIDWNSWQRNPIFSLIQRTGKVSEKEMRKVFNLGIGLVLIVRKEDTNKISEYLKNKKERHFIIGEINK